MAHEETFVQLCCCCQWFEPWLFVCFCLLGAHFDLIYFWETLNNDMCVAGTRMKNVGMGSSVCLYRLLKLNCTCCEQYEDAGNFGVDIELNSRMEVDKEALGGGRSLVW